MRIVPCRRRFKIPAIRPFRTVFTPKYFSTVIWNITFLIIICKGIKRNGKLEHCRFLYNGNWGDTELIEHEKFHENLDSSGFWLGFDTPQLAGKYSGRDGKRE